MDGSFDSDEGMAQLLRDLELCRQNFEESRDAKGRGNPIYAWKARILSAAGPSMPAPNGFRWNLEPDFSSKYFDAAAADILDVAHDKNPRNRPSPEAGVSAWRQWRAMPDKLTRDQALAAVLKALGFCSDASGGSWFARFRRKIRDRDRSAMRRLARQEGLAAPDADALAELPPTEAHKRLVAYLVAREWEDKRASDLLNTPMASLGKKLVPALRRQLAVKAKGDAHLSD